MYTFSGRIRYSETGEGGRLTPCGIINYFQDCSTFQSEDSGAGVGWLSQKKKAWLLSGWRIIVDRFPRLGEKITVGTFPYDFKGIYGYRNFYMQDAVGEIIVKADSVWFLYDLDSGMPVKVTEEFSAPYLTEGFDLGLGKMKKKIPQTGDFTAADPVEIRTHHLDTNHHVNNARYVGIAIEAAGIDDSELHEIRVEYKRAAVLGDIMYPYVSKDEKGATVILSDGEGAQFAVVRLSLRGACI